MLKKIASSLSFPTSPQQSSPAKSSQSPIHFNFRPLTPPPSPEKILTDLKATVIPSCSPPKTPSNEDGPWTDIPL